MVKQMEAEYRVTAGADATLEPPVATQLRDLGSLVDEGADTVTPHTKEGFRMFMGSRRHPPALQHHSRRHLSSADFLPGADANAQERVVAVAQA